MTASVITLGCPKNLVDSEHILGILGTSGFVLSSVPNQSDVVVINTCGFLQSAVAEAKQVIRDCLAYKESGRVRQVVVVGCLVQRMSEDLQREFPELDALVGIDEIARLPQLLSRTRPARQAPALPHGICSHALPRLVSTPSHYAYLRIADGCDNCCSYCMIPGIRGRFRSRTLPDIVREAEMLTAQGTKELLLIAQDTTLYGQDIYARKMLAPLLRRLADIPGIEWLRLMYTHPAHFFSELLQEFRLGGKLLRYVDLPLQHVNDRILGRMNRPYTRSDIERLLDRLLEIPGMAIRTTLITGFPGETDAQFRELLDFVAHGRFAHVGCFAYSPEPGSRAFRFRPQVPARVREERAGLVMQAQRRVALRRNQSLVGARVRVRIDCAGEDGEYLGRTYADAPEVDDTVHIRGTGIRIGDLTDVRITRARAYDLFAESV